MEVGGCVQVLLGIFFGKSSCTLLKVVSYYYLSVLSMSVMGNSVVTDVQFGHLFLVCIKYVALQEVTCGLFRKISHCS